MVTRQELVSRVRDIRVWRRGGERAPHKPLLLLYALAGIGRDGGRPISFAAVDEALRSLLEEFGPPRKSTHPEYPFWRLQNDGLWIVEADGPLESRASNKDAKKSELIAKNATGAFLPEIRELLRRDSEAVRSVAELVLGQSFPESFHQDLLDAVGLDLDRAPSKATRDPAFRNRILRAYEYRCAICGFDARLDQSIVGLEAAHIKWHQAGGPDTEPNGMALCTLHHKLFDRGAFTLSDSNAVAVSERVHGESGVAEWLLAYHGETIRGPIRSDYSPDPRFVRWHRMQVFRAPAREG